MTSTIEELDSIIQRLTMLNKKFSFCISEGKNFSKAKNIFLEIKETHSSLRAYFNKNAENEKVSSFITDGKFESPVNYLIQKWDEKQLPESVKSYLAIKVPVLRYVYLGNEEQQNKKLRQKPTLRHMKKINPTLVHIKGLVITDIAKGTKLEAVLSLIVNLKYRRTLVEGKTNLMQFENADNNADGDTLLIFNDKHKLTLVKHNIDSVSASSIRFDELILQLVNDNG